jgi:glycerol-3-phosphate dehydrogenase
MTPGTTVHTADVTDLPDVDLLVIGGGINGVGIARDAVGRGLSVVLCEQGDLGEGTSSRSSKLIHGGLRYLEFHEFGLVREALAEREVLLANAPHLVRPMRFVLPHDHRLRPAWFVRLGLFLYDHLGHGTGVGQRARLRAGRCGRTTAGASSTPTARSTMPGWCCSTRSMRMSVARWSCRARGLPGRCRRAGAGGPG